MSSPANPPLPPAALIAWADPQREAAFSRWLDGIAAAHGLLPASLRSASADASFRRYLRIDCDASANGAPGSLIIMDAPPGQEDCRPFVKVARLMALAGLNVPRILEWDEASGFMLMDDLGAQTMIEAIAPDNPANRTVNSNVTITKDGQLFSGRPAMFIGYDDVFTRIDKARAHYASVGLGERYVEQFIR